jgi:hypothetical protein
MWDDSFSLDDDNDIWEDLISRHTKHRYSRSGLVTRPTSCRHSWLRKLVALSGGVSQAVPKKPSLNNHQFDSYPNPVGAEKVSENPAPTSFPSIRKK